MLRKQNYFHPTKLQADSARMLFPEAQLPSIYRTMVSHFNFRQLLYVCKISCLISYFYDGATREIAEPEMTSKEAGRIIMTLRAVSTAAVNWQRSAYCETFHKQWTTNDALKWPTIVQQDATIYSLSVSVNSSTCFGWYLHPSSRAHVTVSPASGISKTVSVVNVNGRKLQFRYSRFHDRRSCGYSDHIHDRLQLRFLLMPDAVNTVTWVPDDGWRNQSKHVERFTDINKLYIAASCWTVIAIYFRMHGPLTVKFI